MERREIANVINEKLGYMGRMISGDKCSYNRKFPDNIVVFNANVFVEGIGKVWYGDIDVTRDSPILFDISNTIGKDLYILREHDGRFDKENNPDFEKVAVWSTKR
jgi:hypothetical protein